MSLRITAYQRWNRNVLKCCKKTKNVGTDVMLGGRSFTRGRNWKGLSANVTIQKEVTVGVSQPQPKSGVE